MKKNILFVTYGGGHAHMVYPVIDALKKHPSNIGDNLHIHVLGLTSAKSILMRNGVESFGYSDYLDPVNDQDALEWGKELAEIHHSTKSGIDLNESIAYLGLNFKELVEREGESRARELLEKKGRHAFFPVEFLERVFDDIRPDFVVTTNSPRSEAAAIALANKRGVDNLLMTDLFSLIEGYKLGAKNITFIDELAKKMLLQDGLVDPSISQFHLTGNPAFDKLVTMPRGRDREWLDAEFSGIVGKEVVLHADMPAYWDPIAKAPYFKTEEDILKELDAVYEATTQNGAILLTRPHPSQENELYCKWLNGKNGAYLAAKQDLHQLLLNASLLVVRTSTVGLEACYLGQKVLQLDSNFHSDLPIVEMGMAWGVDSFKDISEAMRSALFDTKKWEQIQKNMAERLPQDLAANNIARIVVDRLTES